jgi:hypothetical protein
MAKSGGKDKPEQKETLHSMVFVGAIVMTESMLLIVATKIRRRCIEKLKKAKALSPETAVTMDELNLDWLEKRHFKRLSKKVR